MRLILLGLAMLHLMVGCKAQPSVKRETYSWYSIETVPRYPPGTVPSDSIGRVKGAPVWDILWKGPFPYDTFVFYKNNDSINMIASDGDIKTEQMFRKAKIHASKWKPKPQYGNIFFFLGTVVPSGKR